jgi:hypothetical protein
MDLEAIISTAADQADEFLAGVTSMTEARPAIRDYLKENHPKLGPLDVQRVTAGLLAILEEEGFFEVGAASDSWDDAEAREKE